MFYDFFGEERIEESKRLFLDIILMFFREFSMLECLFLELLFLEVRIIKVRVFYCYIFLLILYCWFSFLVLFFMNIV